MFFPWKLDKENLLKRVGKEDQFAGIEFREELEGRGKGVRIARFYNTSGLSFEVIPDRGMDISKLSYQGIPLVWISPSYLSSPLYYSDKDTEWGRVFFGGFLTTCGLLNVGPPSFGEGLHGRFTYLKADEVKKETYWEGNDYFLILSGKLEETKLFNENYAIERKIKMNHKDSSFEIFTVITNRAYKEIPLMYLMHLNFGYPLLSPELEVVFSPHIVFNPRDEEAKKDKKEDILTFKEPIKDFKERVFLGEYNTREEEASVTLYNQKLKIGIKLSWLLEEMNYVTIWKMFGEGEYVLGIEPGNTWPLGQEEFKKEGRLDFLLPGEKRFFYLKAEIIDRR